MSTSIFIELMARFMKSCVKKMMGIFILSLSFCAQAQKPDWIDRPYEKKCQKNKELCAVGEGQGVLAAELSARAAIARMFQTQVSSETNISTESSSSESLDQGLKTDFEERVQQQVQQKTDYVLEGAKLKESYTGSESVFALVSLNKKTAAQTLAEQMERLDTKNLELYKQKSRSSVLEIEQNFQTREELHKHYRFLASKTYPSPLSLKKVLELKTKLRENEVTVLLDFDKNVPEVFQHELVSVLMAQGYRAVEKKVKSFDYRMRVEFDAEKRYLNVRGFEKYAISLNMSALTQQGQQLGQLNLSQVEIGRNQEQALEKTLENYKQKLREKFYQLKLD